MAGRWRGMCAAAAVLAVVLIAGCSNEPATQARRRPGRVATTIATTTLPATPPPSALGASSAEPLPGGIPQLVIAAPHVDGYDRDLFGSSWDDADRDCQDARAEVLITESRLPVTFTTSASCTVATGQWVDPWSGAVTTSALALEVDHTVALANAWRSGAWAWTPEQRRAFANDLTDNGHLIAIPSAENQSKADDGPEAWRPPSGTAWCAYARVWTAIKARWNLTATPAEWSAILEMAATC